MVENNDPIIFLDPNPGGKPAVLLLHGLGADKHSWGYQLPALSAAGMRPVAVDVPGFGESPFSGKNWRVKTAAKLLVDWMNANTQEPFDVVGLSMGGVIAQQIALDFPARVRRLVLADTFATLRPKSPKTGVYLLSRLVVALLRGPQKQAEMVAWHIFPRKEQEALRGELIRCIARSDARVYRAAMRQLALFDSRSRLKELTMPVLVIGGAEDATVPPSAQAELASFIRGANQIVIPQAGHAVTVDQPEAFNRALIGFLTRNETD